jgi:hypothetical protein
MLKMGNNAGPDADGASVADQTQDGGEGAEGQPMNSKQRKRQRVRLGSQPHKTPVKLRRSKREMLMVQSPYRKARRAELRIRT